MAKEFVHDYVVTPRDATISGIAYDGSYADWACRARERMLSETVDLEKMTFPWFLVTESYLRFIRPTYLNDRMQARVSVTDYDIGKGYAKLSFQFTKKETNSLAAEGYQVVSFYDLDTGKKCSIPHEFMKLMV